MINALYMDYGLHYCFLMHGKEAVMLRPLAKGIDC